MIRPYQTESIDLIRKEFLAGFKKVLLWLATGGGKTYIFCRMVKTAVAKGKPVIVVVRGRKLVDQASQRLIREGVEHGVLMSKHWNYRPHLPVQVCSIDTLISRGLTPSAELIIIDEAHLAVSKGYKQFLSNYSDSFVVAVTATPYVDGGLRHVADRIVHPISMDGLTELGFLAPFRYYAPSEPDLSNVKVSSSTKDYVVEDLAGVMVAGQLTGKVVEHWKSLAKDRPTLCFAVNIKHSKILVDKFNSEGVLAEHMDAQTPDDERASIIKRLEHGETKVVCNVGVLSLGVDIPCVGAIISARPTKSLNLFIQQAGRGTRPFPGKQDCILLDHSGNIDRHGLPTDEPEVDLDGRQKETHVKKSKTCKECFAVYRGKVCPECGTVPVVEPRKTEFEESDDRLVEFKRAEDPIERALQELRREQRRKGRKIAWVYYRMIERFGLELARPHLPAWFLDLQDGRSSNPFGHSPYKGVKG